VGDGIHDLKVRIGTALHDAAPELHFLVRVVEIHDRQGLGQMTSGTVFTD